VQRRSPLRGLVEGERDSELSGLGVVDADHDGCSGERVGEGILDAAGAQPGHSQV